MSTSNINQVLIRNLELLKSDCPLLINLPYDSFIDEIFKTYPTINLTSFNSNFASYNQHKQNSQYQSYFSASYQNDNQIKHDLVVIMYPKSKSELAFNLAMLANYADENTRIMIVGEKNGGINSSTKLVKPYINYYRKLDAARHCMVFGGLYLPQAPFDIDSWYNYYQLTQGKTSFKVAALPGVFSQLKLDIGTKVLLENLPVISSGKLLDFGCGAGVIACYIAKQAEFSGELHLTDVSALALASSKKTLEINQLSGEIFATDSLTNINGTFDHVITNPPFHQGIKTNYQATEEFLAGIYRHINKNGQLVVVANSFLKYLEIIKKHLTSAKIQVNKQGFSIYHARK